MREIRIRRPGRVLAKTKQRSVHYVDEFENEFASLGEHHRERRWVLVWRIPRDHPFYDPDKPQLMPVPFLAFGDETIADEDSVLLPLFHQIMADAAKQPFTR